MTQEEIKQRTEGYLNRGYSEYDTNIIVRLEDIASILDDCIKDWKMRDMQEFFNYFEKIEQDENITDERIFSYAEYLHGAAIPLHLVDNKPAFGDLTFDFVEESTKNEFRETINSLDWVHLVKEHGEIQDKTVNDFIINNSDVIKYIRNSKHPWAMAFGIYHCIYWFPDYEKLILKFNENG